MGFKYELLNADIHRRVKIKSPSSFSALANQHLIPLALAEFQHACAYFPVAFVKNANNGQFESVAVTGFESGENLWFHDGQWMAEYIPQVATREPFSLTASPDNEEQLLVLLDENSELISESQGEALFNDNGEQTEYLKRRTDSLVKFHEGTMQSRILMDQLQYHDLLAPLSLNITVAGEVKALGGIYAVDRKKLDALAASELSGLQQKGYLLPIYAHLISIGRFEKLAYLSQQKS